MVERKKCNKALKFINVLLLFIIGLELSFDFSIKNGEKFRRFKLGILTGFCKVLSLLEACIDLISGSPSGVGI